jgi:hypothetical protein
MHMRTSRAKLCLIAKKKQAVPNQKKKEPTCAWPAMTWVVRGRFFCHFGQFMAHIQGSTKKPLLT